MASDPGELIHDPCEALRKAAIYGIDATTPRVIETHISHLFLTADHVYKLKKPVDFGFLDYSTLAKRHQACEAEVRLNRRLAPDVYQAVVPVGRDRSGHWQIGGTVEPEDWLVQMRRLPAERCLKQLIRGGEWTPADVDSIVAMLSDFYRSLKPVAMPHYRQRFQAHVDENWNELQSPDHDLPLSLARRVHSAQAQYLFFHGDRLQQREANGHVVEGHGDLRAEHVYVTDPPVVIDGIEFSRELRTVDTADELCFFAMTCDFAEAPQLGQEVLERCCQALGDRPPTDLLDFYRAYRACVRAKVAALRTDQSVGNEESIEHSRAKKLLELAGQYAVRIGHQYAVIVRGLSGTGKTTLAEQLAERLGAVHLATDRIRKEQQLPGSQSYDANARDEVYDDMIHRAGQQLNQGVSVVLDGTFLDPLRLQSARDQLHGTGARVRVITCVCPESVALDRIDRRQQQRQAASSDADASVYRLQLQQAADHPVDQQGTQIDTTHSESATLDELRRVLIGQGHSG